MDCVFCKIVAGEIPAKKVYEDEALVAFIDVNPVNLGHTLVVPKAHAVDLRETSDADVARIFALAKRIGAAASGLGAKGFNIGVNVGEAAGQVVMHTHVHVIPRYQDDGLHLWPKREVPPEDAARAAEVLSATLRS